MALTLATHNPAYTYSGQVLVSYIFTDSRPPKGVAGYVDWLMDGQISDLIIKNKVKGSLGESLLLVTGSKIYAHFLLIIGAGNPKKLRLRMLKEIGKCTAKVLNGLRVSHYGLYPHNLFLSHLDKFKIMDELFDGLKSTSNEKIQVTILSDDYKQQDIIMKWLRDKTYILKPKD